MKTYGFLNNFSGGISTRSKKLGPPNSFAFGRSIDFRSDPSQLTVTPKSVKISGSIVTDLPMWADIAGDNLYFHGNTGNIYKIDANDNVDLEYTISNSQGNGLAYFPEDKYLYIAASNSLSRRSNAIGTGGYTNNFLESEGGAPTNTNALSLIAASSQSVTHIDDASLSITGDLTLEAYLKMTSLPSTSNKMSVFSKWDENGANRSYKLDIIATSASFGDGNNGSLTISADTTDAPIDSACTGAAGTNSLAATNASFAANQIVLIHQTQGTNAGQYETGIIQGYTAGTITLVDKLTGTYVSGAQVLVMKQYTNVTVNVGKTWTAKAWNGTVGGIFSCICNGTFTNNGTILGTGLGFRGGLVPPSPTGNTGEGDAGPSIAHQATRNGSGGGGAGNQSNYAGGGGGNNAYGGTGAGSGEGGAPSGTADLTTMNLGGSGGSGGFAPGSQASGGNGGIMMFIIAATFTNSSTGIISNNGTAGSNSQVAGVNGGGGGGAGGSSRFESQIWTNNGTITATGGSGGAGDNGGNTGGDGSTGRIAINYSTSVTGTTTPTLNSILDSSLSVSNGSALRLYISDDGTNFETYTQDIDDPTGFYKRFSVTWKASTSTANFYGNGDLLGTKTGSKTAIFDSATEFAIGCSKNGAGTRANFLDSLVDDARVFNLVRTQADIKNTNNTILTGLEAGLVAYYKFDNNLNDSQTSGLNNLTNNNAATFSANVAFKGVTTRNDEDVFHNLTGQLYTLTTAVNEGATHTLSFIPTKEPLKSIALNIDTVGTGDWTVVVHDMQNNVLATKTVVNASVQTGVYEFIFASSVRPVRNATYHVHASSTVADGKVVTGTVSDFSTAYFKSFFQILVDDQFHPMKQFINFLVIGNERYIATLEAGSLYTPHRLVLPSGYRVRCLAFWNIYIAIGVWKGNSVTDTDQGKIFLWDGTSDTYIEPVEVSQGAINAMFGTQGTLTISAGYKGKILEYTGGEKAQTKFRIPEIAKTDYVEIAPGAMTMWDTNIEIGVNFNTNSATIHQGIYGYGAEEDSLPMSVGFDFPLSLGDQQSSQVKVASLIPRGQKLYSGWQNGISFGIDIVNVTANPAPTATIELLITDFRSGPRPKLPLIFRTDFEPLLSGQSISLKFKPDRTSSWQTLITQNNAGATDARGIINQRLKEAQFAMDIISTTQSPVVTYVAIESEGEEGTRTI